MGFVIIMMIALMLFFILRGFDWQIEHEELSHRFLNTYQEIAYELGESHAEEDYRKIAGYLLYVLKTGGNWHLRCKAVSGLNDYLCLENRSDVEYRITKALIESLQDEHPGVRQVSAIVLGNAGKIYTMNSLIKVLPDPHKSVRRNISEALTQIGSSVETVVFGEVEDDTGMFEQNHIWCNPDIVAIPDEPMSVLEFPALEEIVINTQTCDISQVGKYMRLLGVAFDKEYLRENVCIRIDGNPGVLGSDIYKMCQQCRHVDISIETIIFVLIPEIEQNPAVTICGIIPEVYRDPLTILPNPDLSDLTLPLTRLRQVIVDTESYSLPLVEKFLTYAVNYIGQKHLKMNVEVVLYGEPKKLHPNLYNSFQNLCKSISAY